MNPCLCHQNPHWNKERSLARKPAHEQGDTRADILQAAFPLFGRYGYEGVSLLRVAQKAGITKAALYWHFAGKRELFVACMTQLHQLYEKHVFQRMENTDDPLAQAIGVFEGMGHLLQDPGIRGGVAGFWLDTGTDDYATARKLQAAFEVRASQRITAMLQAGIAQGVFEHEQPVEDLALAVSAIMEAIVLPMRRHGEAKTRRLVGALAHTFFRAHAPNTRIEDIATAVARMNFGQ